MAANPTLVMDFDDLILRVAEYLGLAVYSGGAAAIPTDAHDLDLCKRLVNDGWRRVVNSLSNWNWLQPTFTLTFAADHSGNPTSITNDTLVDSSLADTYDDDYFNTYTIGIISGTGIGQTRTVSDYDGTTGEFTLSSNWTTNPDTDSQYSVAPSQCVGGQSWRYYLPDGFYELIGMTLTYLSNSGYRNLRLTSEQNIRNMQSGLSESTGTPSDFAIRPVKDDPYSRWEVLVWPKPYAANDVQGVCRIYPNQLSSGSDIPNCGFMYSELVLKAALAEAELEKDEIQGTKYQSFIQALANAMQMNKKQAPAYLGNYGGAGSTISRPYTGPDVYGGTYDSNGNIVGGTNLRTY